LQYAERKGFQVALIAGPDEFAAGQWKVKDLAVREEKTVPTAEVSAEIRRCLSRKPGG
jgi:histidyl-tRNA synthetase